MLEVNEGNYILAKEYALRSLELTRLFNNLSSGASRNKFIKLCSRAFASLGSLYSDLGNYPEALKNHFSSLRLNEQVQDKNNMGRDYSNISVVYSRQGNFKEALGYNNAGLKLMKETGNRYGESFFYNNNAYIYDVQGRWEEALLYYNKALQISEEMGDKRNYAIGTNNIGTVYEVLADQATDPRQKEELARKALGFYLSSLQIKLELNDRPGLVSCYINLGTHHMRRGKYSESARYLEKARTLGHAIGHKIKLAECYHTLSDLDSLTGNPKKQLEDYKLAVAYQDSLTSEENTRKSVEIQMQYEFEKVAAADSVRNVERKRVETEKYQLEISRQRTYTYAGLGGFAVMLVVAGAAFLAFRNKRKATIEIARQKALVEEKQKEILDSIYYARRIQKILMPSERYIAKSLLRLYKN